MVNIPQKKSIITLKKTHFIGNLTAYAYSGNLSSNFKKFDEEIVA